MEKIIELDGLDCANCAAKIERAVAKIKGVSDVSVNFMTQKMIVEMEADNTQSLYDEIVKTAQKADPDVRVIL